ncbi:PREDICTED: sialin [Ceratosolen solmsi marchali]|uniref:Sialin n=1 Tax=Ceratosolen solmsi marchali TaxID=326594 RepID=A0AAJ7DV22_9HYME|nr:PREDICTED: sialin [Ceratosolen solmsi marchali]
MCVMMFTACWTSYMCRLQMPILVVPMIADKLGSYTNSSLRFGTLDNPTTEEHANVLWRSPDDLIQEVAHADALSRFKRQAEGNDSVNPRQILDFFTNQPFFWSSYVRGELLAAYAYGNVPGNFLGGIMALKFGPRKMILWTSLISAIISLISPLIANCHWIALVVSRAIVGFMGGVLFPACHTLVAKWAPPNEKSRFVWSLLGGTFGTIFTFPLIAIIAETINWETGWYLPSVLMLLWVFFWYLLAYDSPVEHPGITDEEKNYIINAQAGSVESEKQMLKDMPVKAIMTSVPFICLIILHFGNIFLLFFYQNSLMLYLTKALGFRLVKGGILVSLPWVARMSFGFFFSWASDTIKRKEILSVTALRKFAAIFSHLVPGVFLIAVSYAGYSFVLANIFLFFALGFNGAASISNLSNNQDLSPNYAGFLYGIMNTIGCVAGMVIPKLVETITGRSGNIIDKWQIVFWINAGVTIFCMLIFIIGGSGKIQPWNEISKTRNPVHA